MVDDTSAVWPAHGGNLLAVERYIYFPSSRRQFGLRGKSLLEVNRSAGWGCWVPAAHLPPCLTTSLNARRQLQPTELPR